MWAMNSSGNEANLREVRGDHLPLNLTYLGATSTTYGAYIGQNRLDSTLGMPTMNCPKCEVTSLTMADRSGVEIDYCPVCRGVWLDRGELDKIIERNAAQMSRPAPYSDRPPMDPAYDRDRDRRRYDDDDDDDDDDRRGRRRRGGLLGELFDF